MNRHGKILTLSGAHLANDISTGAVPAMLPFLVLNFGLSYTETAFIMFGYGVISSIAQPAFGYLSDRWPARGMIAAGVMLSSVGVGLMGYLPWYWAICGCALLTGLGSAIFHPEGAKLANMFGAGGRKATTMSLFAIGGNAGYALGPLIVGALIPLLGMPATAAFPLMGVLAACLLARVLAAEPAPAPRARPQGDNGLKNDWKAFAVLSGVMFSRSVLMSGFHAFLAIYWMREFQCSASVGAAVLSAYGLMSVASNLLGGVLSDRSGYIRVLRLTQAAMLPAVLIFAWTEQSWLALVMALVVAFSLYASFSPTVILGQTYLASNIGFSAGVTLGLTQTIGSLSLPLMGWIADTYGLRGAFLFMACVVVVGLACSLFLKRTEYDR